MDHFVPTKPLGDFDKVILKKRFGSNVVSDLPRL
jgi:hypothetical protein